MGHANFAASPIADDYSPKALFTLAFAIIAVKLTWPLQLRSLDESSFVTTIFSSFRVVDAHGGQYKFDTSNLSVQPNYFRYWYKL